LLTIIVVETCCWKTDHLDAEQTSVDVAIAARLLQILTVTACKHWSWYL